MPADPPSRLRLSVRPGMFWLHVPAALALIAAVLLGLWQINAWLEHRRDEAAGVSRADPVPLQEVMGPDDPFPADAVGRPVIVTGRWGDGETWYVADRLHHGDTGFWVVSPLAVDGGAAIPVVLGWSRTADVDAPIRPGEAEVVGWLQPGESSGSTSTEATDGDVLPRLRIADLLQRVDGDLYGAYVMARSGVGVGLEPVTPSSLPDPPTFTAVRNLLYGLQWWLFGAFAVFLWWRWTRDEIAAARLRLEATVEA